MKRRLNLVGGIQQMDCYCQLECNIVLRRQIAMQSSTYLDTLARTVLSISQSRMISSQPFFVCSICCFPICNTSSGPSCGAIACPVNELLWRLLSIPCLPLPLPPSCPPLATNNDRCARQWQPEIMTNDSHTRIIRHCQPTLGARLSRFAWESVVFMFSLNLLTNCTSRG